MKNDHITEKIEHIQKEFQGLASQISELASMSTERLEEYTNEAMVEVKHATDDVDEYAHRNPWAVIAGASVVGFLIGALFSRKK